MASEHAQKGSGDDQNIANTARTQPVVKPIYVFISSVVLLVPACIPFYFAVTTTTAKAKPLLIGLGISVILLNTLLLVLIVRYINRWARPADQGASPDADADT